uniref:Uncharacterized protein n=1 Tax=Chromera velia CCMP2878 TaxID=1169474 RepID=A0A0G4HA62_9ALVE|eukprot:Cvel_25631.t1-p1 / transcript=Cvel_25631.t1 / gene=Cvel_25631 / organism=Chromera_velia_CCMP2878 / gene_product=hypothetical protein / transcript_product=hypothetical protein / location=Cvel_scaffold2931:2136-8279(+) / protein_length=202 / sequence_SO=supercontig / SO=protein_coding / is_pseudo=false
MKYVSSGEQGHAPDPDRWKLKFFGIYGGIAAFLLFLFACVRENVHKLKACLSFVLPPPENFYLIDQKEVRIPGESEGKELDLFSDPVPHGTSFSIRCQSEVATSLIEPQQKGDEVVDFVQCRSGLFSAQHLTCMQKCPPPDLGPEFAPSGFSEGQTMGCPSRFSAEGGTRLYRSSDPEGRTSLCINGTWTESDLKCYRVPDL